MLLGYVSDEKYVAVADVAVEFIDGAGRSWETRSRASGSVWLELPPGPYEVVLVKPGFGSKRSRIEVAAGRPPHHFRLLSDGLFGYAWPKCVKSGDVAEFRVHAVEQYKLELWRYGWDKEFVRGLGWHDEHGPRATMQITPDGDYTRTGVGWNKVGYGSPSHQQLVEAPARSGLYYFHARTPSGLSFSFPWIVAPARPSAPVAVLASNITWNAYNSFGGRTLSTRLGAARLTRRCRLSVPSRSTTSSWRNRSPTRSKAARRAISRPPNGACSDGSNAKVFPTISTAKRNCTTGNSICRPTAC
jgi:hypothetical protein